MLYRLIRPQLSPSTRAKVQVRAAGQYAVVLSNALAASGGREGFAYGRNRRVRSSRGVCFSCLPSAAPYHLYNALTALSANKTAFSQSQHTRIARCRCAPIARRLLLSCHAAWAASGCQQSTGARAYWLTMNSRARRRYCSMWQSCDSNQTDRAHDALPSDWHSQVPLWSVWGRGGGAAQHAGLSCAT